MFIFVDELNWHGSAFLEKIIKNFYAYSLDLSYSWCDLMFVPKNNLHLKLYYLKTLDK